MHVPPPVLALGAGLVQRVVAGERKPGAVRTALAGALVGASGFLAASALREFSSHGTTVDPVHPEQASALVTSGPFRFSRNPMYVGLTGLLTAHALWRGRLVGVLPVLGFVTYLDRVQVPPEEEALETNFGEEYAVYRRSVPRWVGPSPGRGRHR